MPGVSEDVTRFSEANRRRLYDQVAEMQFAPSEIPATPDQAGLQIVYFAGRWFATWLDLNEPSTLPLHQRFRIARIGASRDRADGIELYEV